MIVQYTDYGLLGRDILGRGRHGDGGCSERDRNWSLG
jgi:hypothetical protein